MSTTYTTRTLPCIETYDDAERILGGRRDRVLCHETVLQREADDAIVCKLFGHTIARWTPVGCSVTLAGWPTTTTRQRLNRLTRASIWQERHVQYLSDGGNHDRREMDAHAWYAIGGETLRNGAQVIARRGSAVLCSWRGEYVTWQTDEQGNAYWGHYCGSDIAKARRDFNERPNLRESAAYSGKAVAL